MCAMKTDPRIAAEEALRDSIVSDFSHNYFVEAGAGAGKTSLVVDRITAQLKKGYKPSEIAAITFTNKAAQELCRRISENLRKVPAGDPDYGTVRAALQDIGRMQISTIHSFCHRILSENCFDAKLRLDFELLEEEDASAAKKAFFRDWFNRNAAEFIRFNEESPEEFSYADFEKNFLEISELPKNTVFAYEDPGTVTQAKLDALNTSTALAKEIFADEFIEGIEAGLATAAAGTPVDGCRYTELALQIYLKPEYRKTADFDAARFFDSVRKDVCPFVKKGNKADGLTVNAALKGTLTSIADSAMLSAQPAFNAVLDAEKEAHDMAEARVNALAMSVLLKARDEYLQQKFNRYLSNDILLQKANALLKNEAAAEKVRRMFRCIFVDEAQDTDPVQNEMILNIGMRNGAFIPGLLFIVGDVKQSIYRFREADYRLFNHTKALFEAHPATCKVCSLNINNRSNADLVDFINLRVKRNVGDLIPGYTDMVPRKDYRSPSVLHGVYKVTDKKTFPNGTKEPELIAAIIRNLLGKPITVYDSDRRTEVVRSVTCSDFLVLTANAKGNSAYVEALQAAGIPARVTVEYCPGDMAPLRRFVTIYSYLAMPCYRRGKEGLLETAQQDTSCDMKQNDAELKELRSAVAGMSGAEMAGWLLERGELYLYGNTRLNGNPFVDGFAVKRYEMAVRQMVDQTLSRCEDNPVVIANAFKEYVGEDSACDREIGYDKNEDAVRLMNLHKAKGLEGNIVILAQRKGKDDRESTYIDDADAVKKRYQTIETCPPSGFQAKSYSAYALRPDIKAAADLERDMETARLEYVGVTRAKEVLIFMDAQKENPLFDAYLAENSYGSGTEIPELLALYPLSDAAAAGCIVGLTAADPAEHTAEKYAAVTEPAGEETAVFQTVQDEILHAARASEEVFVRTGYKISPSSVEIHRPSEKDETADLLPAEEQVPEESAEECYCAAMDGTTSDTIDAMIFEDDLSSSGSVNLNENISETAGLLQKQPAGAVFGTVMHRVFELAVRSIRKNQNDWTLCVDRAINENSDDIELKYKNSAEAKDIFRANLLEILPEFVSAMEADICSAEEVFTEYPFSLAVSGDALRNMKSKLKMNDSVEKLLPAAGTEDSNPLWVNGKADLVLKTGNQFVIWDYKSDVMTDGETPDAFAARIHETYDNQMELYKWVFAHQYGCEVTGRFYSRIIGRIES